MKPQSHQPLTHWVTKPQIHHPPDHWVTKPLGNWVTMAPPHHLALHYHPNTRAIGSPIHPTIHQAPTPQIHRATGPPFIHLPQVPGSGSQVTDHRPRILEPQSHIAIKPQSYRPKSHRATDHRPWILEPTNWPPSK
jgi:hypothetical protein